MTRVIINPNVSTSYADAFRSFYVKWRVRRQCEARARALETILREMDPRLHRDLGFELMAGPRSDPTALSHHALIQAVAIAFASERREGE